MKTGLRRPCISQREELAVECLSVVPEEGSVRHEDLLLVRLHKDGILGSLVPPRLGA